MGKNKQKEWAVMQVTTIPEAHHEKGQACNWMRDCVWKMEENVTRREREESRKADLKQRERFFFTPVELSKKREKTILKNIRSWRKLRERKWKKSLSGRWLNCSKSVFFVTVSCHQTSKDFPAFSPLLSERKMKDWGWTLNKNPDAPLGETVAFSRSFLRLPYLTERQADSE